MFPSGYVSMQAIFYFFTVASPVEQQAAADKPHAPSKQQPPPCEETKASGTNEDTLSLSKESVQVCSKHSISGSTHDLGMETYSISFGFNLYYSS